jgi:uncharacterized membrane protein (UPF0127 family)
VPSFLSPILRDPGNRFALRNARNNQLIASRVETAFDSATRRRGLLGRTVFEEGSALIIAPTNAIHTFFMRLPIDVLFASSDGRVLKKHSILPAWRMAFAFGAFAVIELPSGTLARLDLRRDDILRVEGDELRASS